MITRIEIDGFKTFQDFTLDLLPFQVIVGQNGSGKSNLFDALHLLSRLAEADLRTAFADLRGEATELFTVYPDGRVGNQMRLAVELFVDTKVKDSWGAEEELLYPRLRYELTIVLKKDERGLDRLYVSHEALKRILRAEDLWLNANVIPTPRKETLPPVKRGRKEGFIETDMEADKATIYLHADGHGGRKAGVAANVERTVLSGVTNTEFPHAFAAREEMRTWSFLQLNPEVLREPSSMLSQPFLASDGSNLPTTLARIKAEDPALLCDISRDLTNLVPGILTIDVEQDEQNRQYVAYAKTQEGGQFSSRVLSDGTLRLLALATLRNDPDHHGVLCFEEPENGVHPSRLAVLTHILRDMATQFSAPEQASEPLRQLLVNTHSPKFISQLDLKRGELLFAYMATRVRPHEPKANLRVTHIIPVAVQPTLDMDNIEQRYSRDQVIQYLDNAEVDSMRAHLVMAAK
jgi:predicted ATPase